MGNMSDLISAWGSVEVSFAEEEESKAFHSLHSLLNRVGGARARRSYPEHAQTKACRTLPGACANAEPARGVACCRAQAPQAQPAGTAMPDVP